MPNSLGATILTTLRFGINSKLKVGLTSMALREVKTLKQSRAHSAKACSLPILTKSQESLNSCCPRRSNYHKKSLKWWRSELHKTTMSVKGRAIPKVWTRTTLQTQSITTMEVRAIRSKAMASLSLTAQAAIKAIRCSLLVSSQQGLTQGHSHTLWARLSRLWRETIAHIARSLPMASTLGL